MIKLVYCCRRKQGMTREEFQARWHDVHGPLVRKVREQIPTMQRYVQSHTLPDEANAGLRASRGTPEPYDGITEIWFDSVEAMSAGGGAEVAAAGRKLLEDEAEFIDFERSNVFLTEEHEIF